MEFAAKFMWVLATSSVWLAGSGLVLWLCMRSRMRLSPETRAVASVLIVLQGWIWIGIPVHVDKVWIQSQLVGAERQEAEPIEAAEAAALPTDTELPLAASSTAEATPAAIDAAEGAPRPIGLQSFGSMLTWAANAVVLAMPMAGLGAAAIWMAGIAVVFWRSIGAFVALSRMVYALPRAPVDWQKELSTLSFERKASGKQSIVSPLVLKIGDVASPMLVQTWRSVSIVVPAWLWESCTAEQRRSILLHELAHYRRGDVWRQLAMRLLVLPHWFNPVAWWAARQFEAASEAACDEAACGGQALQAISYSKALLVLNETIVNKRAGARYSHALAISGGSLTERIRRVLHPELHKESRMSRILILSAMILLAGLAAIRIQVAAEPPATAKIEITQSLPITIRIEAAEQSAASEKGSAESKTAKDESAKATGVSLLANGSFEDIQDGADDPKDWFATRVPQNAGHFVLASSSVAHSGKRSVVLEIGENHPEMRVDYNWTAEANGWKAGETYELSGWIKTENVTYPAVITVQFWPENPRGKRMLGGASTEQNSPVKGTSDWTKVSTRFVVPEGTGAVRVRAGLSSKDNRGAKAWIDDISMVKVAPSANDARKKVTNNAAGPAPGGSLLANGGFEEPRVASEEPEGWFATRWPKTPGHYILAPSSSVAHGGKRSVVVEIGDSHPDDKVAYNWTAEAQGWKAGETYELSGWVKTENVNHPAFVMAQFWDENKKMIGGATTQTAYPVKGTTGWTRVSTRLKVPEGTAALRIRAGLSSQDNRGAKAWLDDLSLVKVAAN